LRIVPLDFGWAMTAPTMAQRMMEIIKARNTMTM
jgi:hypothetical protein